MSTSPATLTEGPIGAQALVLLDSIGAGPASWDPIVGPFSEQFRVIRPKVSGSLEHAGQEVIAALDTAGVRRAHIAGAGFGGLVALWLAVHHPDRVSRLAVIGTGARSKDASAWKARATQLRAGSGDAVRKAIVAEWLTPELIARDAGLAARVTATLAGASAEELAQACDAGADADLGPDLGRIAANVLVVAGSDDATVTSALLDELTAALPQAKLARIPKAAHLVALEAPAQLSKLLLNHFGSAATLEIGYVSRRQALGDAHIDKTIANFTEFTRPFQDFLTRYCWGEVWTRDGLSRRDRSLATIAVLVSIGAEHEIPVHVRAGLRHGLKIGELQELYEHLALYTGLPRAFGALNITQKTLAEDGLIDATPGA